MAGGKKAEQKKKEKIIEDKTFGLKNKNRSAKVQAYVQQIAKSVHQVNPNDRRNQSELEAKRREREEKKAKEAEIAKLFNDVDNAMKKKGRGAENPDAPPEDERELRPGEEYLLRTDDFDDVEYDETQLDDQLNDEREKIRERTDLTPVTEETFMAWLAQKKAEAEAEMSRQRTGKQGEKAMRGWDLWQVDKDLFVDDDDANEFYERGAQEDDNESANEEEYDLS